MAAVSVKKVYSSTMCITGLKIPTGRREPVGLGFELGTTDKKSSKWPQRGSNPEPLDCESDALTTQSRGLLKYLRNES